jgi:parallel beta-helix repeat protein
VREHRAHVDAMQKNMRVVIRTLVAAGLLAAAIPGAAHAETITVTSTIQDAVDAASPGDTIVVPRGVYHESVLVAKDRLTIRGSRSAVLDASGFEDGMRVGAGEIGGDPPTCPALSVRGFTLDGLTIRNAGDTGLRLTGVDGFRVSDGVYEDNAEYGVFPRCSTNGLIEGNRGGGGEDATVYVGVDENVTVVDNHLTNGEIGIELENTLNTVVRRNVLSGNVAGMLIIVLPGLPRSATSGALIEGNVVTRNNLPNPFPPPPPFFDDLQLLPSGTGILNAGGDNIVIRHNTIIANDTVGVGIIENPFGFGPPDNNTVVRNTIEQNGLSPDARAAGQAGDIVYDGTGTGNCFTANTFRTDYPPGITAAFPCP